MTSQPFSSQLNAAPNPTERLRSTWWKAALLGVLISLLVLFAFGLRRDPTFMPSALVGRTLPGFELATLGEGKPIRSADFIGKPHVINFWASWCGACRTEHAVLVDLGRTLGVTNKVGVIGINYRDTKVAAERFLKERGAFPYPSALDPDARTGVDFGVFGLPETFFVDARGMIKARHIGALTKPDAEKYLRMLESGQ
ncbi:MAG: redoxin family protein [Hyphomicrobium sp.]